MTSEYQLTLVTRSARTEVSLIELEDAADRCGLHPGMIEEFLRGKLVRGFTDEEGAVYFDQAGLLRLRQIAHFRHREHANLKTLRYIVGLLDTLDAREQELRELRERLR